jgi:hypothetical protein
MIVQIIKGKNNYTTSIAGLPGSPPIGKDRNKEKAIKQLLLSIMKHHCIWCEYIDFSSYKEIFVDKF